MSAKRSSSVVALRYAAALVDVAFDRGVVDEVERDLDSLKKMFESGSDLRKVMFSPLLKKSEKEGAISAISKKCGFCDVTANFLLLLVRNGRVDILDDISNLVHRDIRSRRGEIDAVVSSACELSDTQVKELKKALADMTGKKVVMSVNVDESLIGGMVVRVGSSMIDDSVRRKLELLGYAMNSGGSVRDSAIG